MDEPKKAHLIRTKLLLNLASLPHTLISGVFAMSHQEQVAAINDELTSAVQSVVESFKSYRADHSPDLADFDRWLIWNDQTSERLGIVALDGPREHALPLVEKKVLLRSRAMDLLRNAA
jgi:hypothetical protein